MRKAHPSLSSLAVLSVRRNTRTLPSSGRACAHSPVRLVVGLTAAHVLEAAEVTKLDVALALHIRLEAQAVVELQVAVQQHTSEVVRLYARHNAPRLIQRAQLPWARLSAVGARRRAHALGGVSSAGHWRDLAVAAAVGSQCVGCRGGAGLAGRDRPGARACVGSGTLAVCKNWRADASCSAHLRIKRSGMIFFSLR